MPGLFQGWRKFRFVWQISMKIHLTLRNITSYGQLSSTTWELNQITNTPHLKKYLLAYMLLWQRRKRNLFSNGTLCSAEWQLHTDVSGQHIGPSLRVIDPTFIDQVLSMKMRPTSCPKRRQGNTITSCLKSQKNADVIYIAAETWNHAAQMELNIYFTSP